MRSPLQVDPIVEAAQRLRRDALAARLRWGGGEAPSCESGCRDGGCNERHQQQISEDVDGGDHWTTAELMPQESADQISVIWLGRHTS